MHATASSHSEYKDDSGLDWVYTLNIANFVVNLSKQSSGIKADGHRPPAQDVNVSST